MWQILFILLADGLGLWVKGDQLSTFCLGGVVGLAGGCCCADTLALGSVDQDHDCLFCLVQPVGLEVIVPIA